MTLCADDSLKGKDKYADMEEGGGDRKGEKGGRGNREGRKRRSVDEEKG